MATDLALLDNGHATLDPETFAPFGVRGPDMVAQRFLYALMTPSGSVPGRPSAGTHFLSMIASFGSEFDLYAAFATCEPKAVSTVQSWETSSDPSSDRIGGARLAGMEFIAGALTLTFEIATLDRSRPTQTIDYTLDV